MKKRLFAAVIAISIVLMGCGTAKTAANVATAKSDAADSASIDATTYNSAASLTTSSATDAVDTGETYECYVALDDVTYLLQTNGAYEDSANGHVTFFASVYDVSGDEPVYLGDVNGAGTSYPILSNGKTINVAGAHFATSYTVKDGELVETAGVTEGFDADGNSTYTMVDADGKEQTLDSASDYTDKYNEIYTGDILSFSSAEEDEDDGATAGASLKVMQKLMLLAQSTDGMDLGSDDAKAAVKKCLDSLNDDDLSSMKYAIDHAEDYVGGLDQDNLNGLASDAGFEDSVDVTSDDLVKLAGIANEVLEEEGK